MDGELFRALRSDGMSEELAAKWARFFARREDALKADIAELRARIPDREAERAADREVFAAKGDVTVLQTEMTDVKAAIVRIDKSIGRIDETLASMKEMLARLDERINGMESQNGKFFYIFFSLHIITITGLFGLLTKGILWGVAP